MKTYYVSGAISMLFHLNLMTTQWGGFYYLFFLDKKIEAQRS